MRGTQSVLVGELGKSAWYGGSLTDFEGGLFRPSAIPNPSGHSGGKWCRHHESGPSRLRCFRVVGIIRKQETIGSNCGKSAGHGQSKVRSGGSVRMGLEVSKREVENVTVAKVVCVGQCYYYKCSDIIIRGVWYNFFPICGG